MTHTITKRQLHLDLASIEEKIDMFKGDLQLFCNFKLCKWDDIPSSERESAIWVVDPLKYLWVEYNGNWWNI
jgi:hypothetical protein